MIIRGRVVETSEGVIKRFAADGLVNVEDREYFQHYGFTSRPKAGAEIIYLLDGNIVIAFASDDRRYRLRIEEGEAAIHDDLGQKVHLTREGIVAESPTAVTAIAPQVNLGGDRAGLLALIDERILALINSHTHPGVKAGSDISAPPVLEITPEMVCTEITRAK